MPILGKPSCEYAYVQAIKLVLIIDMSQQTLMRSRRLQREYDFKHIERPAELATSDALTEDALLHTLQYNEKGV